MVVLNLRGDCLARTATNFQQGMTDKRFLELEIRAWLHSPARKRQLAAEAYYDGAQDVLHRRRVALDDDGHIKVLDHLPNNRLVNNIYAKMVDQKTNYSFGRPFSFDTEDKGYAKALNSVLGPKFRRVMRNVGEGAWIGGKCWLFPYYEGGELAFKRFPADEVLPFWADADHTVLDAAVHVYAVLEYDETEVAKDVVKAEVMHGGGVDCFILRDDGTLEPDPEARSGPYITAPDPETGEETGYNWERIPLVCFKSSQHEIPLLSKVKCLQDAYNSIVSNCSATSFLRNWDSILEKKRANLRSISEPARLRQPPPRSTGAAHARGRAQSIREERRIAAPPVLFALLWVRLLPALYGPFCGPLRPFGGCPWGVTPPARECLPPAPPDTRRRG